jgi:hypothetical protein
MAESIVERLSDMSDADLDEHLRNRELARRAIDAEIAVTVAFIDARKVGAGDGHRSTHAYLKATCNWSGGEAVRAKQAARFVDRFPAVFEAWRVGRIGRAQVDRLARLHANPRVRDRLPEFMPMLTEYAEQMEHDDFVTCVDRYERLADADGAFTDEKESVEGRWARVTNVGPSLDLRAEGGDSFGTDQLVQIFKKWEDDELAADLEARRAEFGDDAEQHPLPRTGAQRSFDAIRAAFRASVGDRGAGAAPAGGLDVLTNLHIDDQTYVEGMFRLGLVDDPKVVFGRRAEKLIHERRCETGNGVPLRPEHAVAASLVGQIRRVVYDSRRVVVNQGERQRLYTGPAREAAMMFASSCLHPGCGVQATRCQVDHSTEWADHGRTDQDNAAVRCGSHNRFKHRAKLRDRRDVDGRLFTLRADGSVMQPVGQRPPVFPDEDDAEGDRPPAIPWPVVRIDLADCA